jgi:diamine N-acetyltransferase
VEGRNKECPTISVEGELVALGPLRRDLVPTYHRWHNDVGTTRTYALPQPTTVDQDEAWFAELSTHRDTTVFTVYERVFWRGVGTAYLTDIDHRQRRAEFGVWISEAACRGREYGTEAARLVLDFAFTALGLHRVMLTCYEYNLAGRWAFS